MFHVEHCGGLRELLEGEPAGGVAGEGDAFGRWGGFCREDGEPAVRGDVESGLGEGLLHVVDGAEGDDVEAATGRQRVDPCCPDFGGQVEGADGFAEERGLLALRFGEGYAKFGVQELDGKAG